jgi:broad specificity phosphatase PhoE
MWNFDEYVTKMEERRAQEKRAWFNAAIARGLREKTHGESVAELSKRIWSTVQKIVCEEEGKTVVIATHATPIRVLQARIENRVLDEYKNVPWTSNASLTEVTVEKEEWRLIKVGVDEYLSTARTSFPANV